MFARLCIKIEKKFNTTGFNGILESQKSCTWMVGPSLVYSNWTLDNTCVECNELTWSKLVCGF